MRTHNDLISDLGGNAAVAQKLCDLSGQIVTNTAVHMWRKNGVPWRWRYLVAEVAAEKRVPLPPGFFDPAQEPAQKAAANG